MTKINYLVRDLDEIDSNPLAAHLPLAPVSPEACGSALYRVLKYSPQERELPAEIRLLKTFRLKKFIEPPPQARFALQCVMTQVIHSYFERNPLTPLGRKLMHGFPVDLKVKPEITMITGLPGMGKSTVATAITDYLSSSHGQAVYHDTFHGEPVCLKQLTYVRRNLPARATMNSICENFGDTVDSALEENIYAAKFRKIAGRTNTNHVNEMRKIIAAHGIGLLVFDEFQNLSLRGRGAKEVLQMLVNFRDELGVPILVVGTTASRKIFEKDPAAARRLSEGGCFEIQRPTTPHDKWFQQLCREAWNYSWVRDPVDWDDGFFDKLFDVSQGIPAILLTAMQKAQSWAITEGLERVDMDVIQHVYDQFMTPVHAVISALRLGDYRSLAKLDGILGKALRDLDKGESEADMPPTQSKGVDREGEVVQASKSAKPNKAKLGRTRPVIQPEELKSFVTAPDSVEVMNRMEAQA